MANKIFTINVRYRLIRFIVFMILLLGVVFFSQNSRAQGVNPTYNKAKYRIAVHKSSDRTCYILHKKRTSMPKHHAMMASAKRSRKDSRALAETDSAN
jgi:hypothetical protein